MGYKINFRPYQIQTANIHFKSFHMWSASRQWIKALLQARNDIYLFTFGALLLGYLGARGKDSVLGRRKCTVVLIFLDRLS